MMPGVGELLYLSREEVERLLDIDAMLDALGKALIAFSAGITTVPPRVGIRVPDLGILGTMPGYVPGVALEVKLVSVFPGNRDPLPSHQGLIALFDEGDGRPLAIMDGTYITGIRTGGTAAVAARALARKDARVLAILGAGVQGASRPFPAFATSRRSGSGRETATRLPAWPRGILAPSSPPPSRRLSAAPTLSPAAPTRASR